jgi:soluble lytic murein transglycosylase-like protein
VTPSPEILRITFATAARHGLDPTLVCAVAEQESGWDADAIRYEPAFRARYVASLNLSATEEIARSVSWGLMQVMGQVAREHGFRDKFLSKLCVPPVGLEIGCTVLAAKLAAAEGDRAKGLALWNGGANLAYADEVLARLGRYVSK